MDSPGRRAATDADRRCTVCIPVGMRRVNWVRIVISGTAVLCDVHDIGHRLPCRRPLNLASALALRAAGVPTVIRTESPDGRRLLKPEGGM